MNICLGLLLSHTKANAQNFIWQKQFGGINHDTRPISKIIENNTVIGCFHTNGQSQIDSLATKKNSLVGIVPIVYKLDSNNKVVWLWQTDSILSDFSDLYINAIALNKNNNDIYLCGHLAGDILINNTIYSSPFKINPVTKIKKTYNTSLIIKLDSNGKFKSLWFCEQAATIENSFFDIKLINDTIYILFWHGPGSINKYQVASNAGIALFKFDLNLNYLNTSDNISSSYNPRYRIVDDNEELMVIYGNTDKTIVNDTTLFYAQHKGLCLAKINKQSFKIKEIKTLSNYTSLVHSAYFTKAKQHLLFVYLPDSMVVLAKDSTYLTISNKNNGILIAFDNDGFYLWHKQSEPINKKALITHLETNNDLFYGGGYINPLDTTLKFDDFTLEPDSGFLWIMKGDKDGNFIWIKQFGKSYNPGQEVNIDFDKKGDVLFSLAFDKSLEISNKVYTAKGKNDILLIKIGDLEIYRGEVFKGPYCAGDSIAIPFTTNKRFNSDNSFFAELSDENGLFEGNQKFLGKIYSDNSSIIKGIIPQFDVISSNKYRIRIISSSPKVQSYYKIDTLKLLIYSKDKANAGRDTSICFGSKLIVKTTGGTKWKWSPGNLFEDSTKRITTFNGNKSTLISITISDSSGCGVTDTAYKMINVKEPLTLLNKDSTICANKYITLKSQTNGGLSSRYETIWMDQNKNFISRFDSIKQFITKQEKYYLQLKDNCSTPSDTFQFIINVPSLITFKKLGKDSLCFSEATDLQSLISGGLGELKIHWQAPYNEILPPSSVKTIIVTKDTSIKLKIEDFCGLKPEIHTFSYKVYPLPKIVPINDTSVCYGSMLNLAYNTNLGKNPYQVEWTIDDNNSIKKYTSQTVSPSFINNSSTIIKILDGCNNSTTDSFNINILPIAKINLNYDSAFCIGEISKIQVKLDQPNWLFKILDKPNSNIFSISSSTLDTIVLLSKTTQFSAISYDNCATKGDTQNFTIYLKGSPNAAFIYSPNEPTIFDSLFLKALDSFSIVYQWFINDSLKGNKKHFNTFGIDYQNETNLKVKLIATNKFGCSDSSVQNILLRDGDFIYIPNVFSPNNDGLNDEFKPIGKSILSYQIKVFNRHASKVFDGKLNQPWQGFDYSLDYYIYIIEIIDQNNKKHEFKNIVYLVK